jgi:hypothetical protein
VDEDCRARRGATEALDRGAGTAHTVRRVGEACFGEGVLWGQQAPRTQCVE